VAPRHGFLPTRAPCIWPAPMPTRPGPPSCASRWAPPQMNWPRGSEKA